MKRFIPLLCSLLICIGSAFAQEKSQIQTFPLHHRNAEEMVQLLRPMIPGAAITGTGYKLIVRGTLDELVEVERMLASLDTAPEQLLITVRQGGRLERSQQGTGVTGRIGSEEAQGEVRVYGTDRRHTDSANQQLRVLEGSWARIDAGQSVPITQSEIVYGPHGALVRESTQYHDVGSGFEVRPRLNGSQVSLDIRPFRGSVSSRVTGAFDVQEIVTSVSGRLGEWIQLGGTFESSSRSRSGTVYSTDSRNQQTSDVYVKVERVQ